MSRKITVILVLGLFLLSATATLITDAKESSKIVRSQNNMIEVKGNLAPVLSYDPTSHDFGDKYKGELDSTTFEIWNSGCCILSYSLYENCSWVDVNPTSGSCSSSGEHDTITVSIDTSDLDAGSYQCDILIDSNSGTGVFSVYLNIEIATTSILTFYPRSYNFGDMLEEDTDSTSFEIWNCGINALNYTLSESYEWVDVSPMGGSSTGEHDTITVSINTSGLDAASSYQCSIQIVSNGGNEVFSVHVNVKAAAPTLYYYPSSFNFGSMSEQEVDFTMFEIWNLGVGYLTYSLIENCSWIDVSPTSGSSSGEHDTISVSVDTSDLASGYHSCKISITSNGGRGDFTVSLALGDGYTDITVEEAWALLNDTSNGIQIPIDVRFDVEWAEEHIDTPPPENPRHSCVCSWSNETTLQEFMSLYKGKEIILYCKSGGRSVTAASILVENEFDGTIYNMLGGITEWKNAGYPTIGNLPPGTPTITGPTSGNASEEYQYTFVTTDIDSDDVYYYVNWSDNTGEVRIGPYSSDEKVIVSHIWAKKGTYTVRIKAEDIYGAESDWATLEVSMPKNKIIKSQIFNFLQYQHLLQIMRQILQSLT